LRIYELLTPEGDGLEFFTRTLPCFTELHTLFYPSRTKIIPSNIYELLTPVALAHVIQGDGLAKPHGLIICTDSYKVVDVVRLMNVLMIRYRLECTLRYHRPTHPRIYIRERSIPLLQTIVRPHIHSSIVYKIKSLESTHYTITGERGRNFSEGSNLLGAGKGIRSA
jgi:hypothetical protein